MGARRVLGGVKHGIKFLGRANNFARQLGVNNPTFNQGVSMLEKYGNPHRFS
jgi:DNA-binding transcriptional regulator YdaS (Cro superfamily)